MSKHTALHSPDLSGASEDVCTCAISCLVMRRPGAGARLQLRLRRRTLLALRARLEGPIEAGKHQARNLLSEGERRQTL